MSFIIGLTGPTGAGKSETAEVAESLGIKVINCDKVARKVVEKGTDGLAALTKAFSENILNPDGTLNRRALARIAFKTEENTKLLNDTLFPFIIKEIEKEVFGKTVLLDAPTLFESGADKICNKIIAVSANPDIRLKRIMERDNISKEDALIRMNAGKPEEFYTQKSDVTVYNNGDITKYKNEIKNILIKFLEEI